MRSVAVHVRGSGCRCWQTFLIFRSIDLPRVKRERHLVRRDWGAWLSLARRSKPSAHPLDASRHSNLSTHSQMLTPSGFPNGATCTGSGANAAGSRSDLKICGVAEASWGFLDIALCRRLLFNEQARA